MAKDNSFYDIIKQFGRPLTKYKLPQQPAEIDKRLAALHEYCAGKNIAPTKTHVYAILGIDDNTYLRWLNMVVQYKTGDSKGAEKTEEEKRYIGERREILKKWQLLAESALMEIIQGTDKPAGAIFTAKSVYQYREYDEKQQVNINIGIENFLEEAGKKEKHIIVDVPEELPTPDMLMLGQQPQ